MMSRRRRRWWFYRDTLPLIVIIGTQCSDTALSTLFKAATDRGMSHHVFVAYAYALATTLLLPYLFFFKRSSSLAPPISFSILIKIVLLGVLGSSSQVLGYAGINYSSPALASSISNLLPAFTFLLAIAFRMEKVAAKSRSSQAKVVGSIVSIAGAFVVTFYKGPSVNIAHSHLSLPTGRQIISIPNSVDTTWVIAGALLTADYLLVSLCYIWQAEILKEYPDELTVVFFYNVTATIVSVTVALFTEPSASAWEIGLDISLVSIICSGIFGKLMSNAVNAWALHLKGAVYVATFQPLSIVIATAMGVVFLCDTLHIGRCRGAPPLSFSTLMKIVLLGVLGSSSQVLGYAGISYSSPALASSISNLLPAFTFLLAIAFRKEKLAAKSRSSQAKVIGSIVSIAGAFVVTFYKGPSINIAQSHLSLPTEQQVISIPNSVDTTWVIAGALLTADYLLISLGFIWQVEIMKEYPDELSVVFFYNVTATIVSFTVALFTEPRASAWKIGLDISLVSIVCSGIFGKFMSNAVYTWALHLKGAVYVATFRPLSIVIAIVMGVVFLGDTLHIGSIIGATIISIGFYTVLWGKATEETEEEEDFGNQESETSENVPLLHSYKTAIENVHNTSTNSSQLI